MPLTTQTVKDELLLHPGVQRAIKAPELAAKILKTVPTDGDTRTVRKLVKELRLKGEPICSHSSSGYWWAANPEELQAACEFLRGKALSSLKQYSYLRRFVLPKLTGQLSLVNQPTDEPEPSVMALPGNLLALLDEHCAETHVPRDMAVRAAVARYLTEQGMKAAKRFCD
ncbi:MAG: hypothetical protein AAGI44_05870 [Pseudomonadota bacterium]